MRKARRSERASSGALTGHRRGSKRGGVGSTQLRGAYSSAAVAPRGQPPRTSPVAQRRHTARSAALSSAEPARARQSRVRSSRRAAMRPTAGETHRALRGTRVGEARASSSRTGYGATVTSSSQVPSSVIAAAFAVRSGRWPAERRFITRCSRSRRFARPHGSGLLPAPTCRAVPPAADARLGR